MDVAREPSRIALRILTLGCFAVQIDGVPLPRLRTQQGYRLFAMLLLRRGMPVERTFLSAALWPEHSGDQLAPAHLRRCLTDLRHALGPAANRITAPAPRQLQFDLAPSDSLDIDDFEQVFASDARFARDRAIALYRGPLLEGHDDDWTTRERHRLDQLYADVLARH